MSGREGLREAEEMQRDEQGEIHKQMKPVKHSAVAVFLFCLLKDRLWNVQIFLQILLCVLIVVWHMNTSRMATGHGHIVVIS